MASILLIDDDERFRRMLGLTLERSGYKVISAANGKVALSLYRSDSVDLVLTDLIMPEKEGLETIRELKRLNPGVKIIAMSGGGRINAADFLKVAKQLGAAEILAKPFSNDELMAALAKVLGTD